MPTIEEQLRFFAVKVNNGSGCLFQPDTLDYSYVLTVKHNLKKADNSICLSNEITVLTSNLDGEPLRIIAVIIDENLDLALLVIEFIGDSDYPLSFSKPKREEKVVVYGYPNYRFNEAIKTTSLPCISDFEHQNNISFELISEKPMFSFNRGAQQNVIGFSGSGIFRIESNRLILKGIFLSLDNTEGAHNKLNGYYIDCFNYMLNNSTYLELMPSYLTSFKEHKINVFNSINQLIRNGLSPNLANILDSGITPNSIAEQFKGNLYAPYSENYRDKLLNQKMWKAWV